MQPSDHSAVKDEASVASSSAMDVDLTPPKKRIKSGQSSRRASAEPVLGWDDDQVAGRAVKVEEGIDEAASALALLAEASISAPTPPSDATATPQPPSKKKKSSTTKKEASSSSSTPKPKKFSSSTKKGNHHADPSSSSRTKPKVEIQSPPPPPTTLDSEDEDTALYCTCQRRQDDVEGGMIMCDRCEQWYHYRCMQITEDDAELVDQFICPPCHAVTGQQTTYKTACARGGCRRAAMEPFSKYCSDRCGVLKVTERLKGLKVDRKAKEVFEADRRVGSARKGEGFTKREEGWERVVREEVLVPKRNLRLTEAYAMMVKEEEAEQATSAPNGAAQPNGTSTASPPTNPNESSSLSLIAIDEQLSLITRQLTHLDLSKTLLNARLDRLDLRSMLLHLVSDRVPTLAPIGSSSITADADADAEEADEASKKSKKKSSKSKTKPSSDTSGPRCGYDQRLHWDDPTFDTWTHTSPGSSILAHDLPLDGSLDDVQDGGTVCALPKRKCRRHLDWSNLCELALDAEKSSLNADSRVLTQRKLVLVEKKQKLEVEREAVKDLIGKQEERERRKREERDRDVAMRMANEGTRRGG